MWRSRKPRSEFGRMANHKYRNSSEIRIQRLLQKWHANKMSWNDYEGKPGQRETDHQTTSARLRMASQAPAIRSVDRQRLVISDVIETTTAILESNVYPSRCPRELSTECAYQTNSLLRTRCAPRTAVGPRAPPLCPDQTATHRYRQRSWFRRGCYRPWLLWRRHPRYRLVLLE